jgi:cellobiose phosphorylase
MSCLPGRVLNFKIPHARPFYQGYRKKIEMGGIYCHKNTKFLHAIAGLFVPHAQKSEQLRVFRA